MTARNITSDLNLEQKESFVEILAKEGIDYDEVVQQSTLEKYNQNDSKHGGARIVTHQNLPNLCQNIICKERAVK